MRETAINTVFTPSRRVVKAARTLGHGGVLKAAWCCGECSGVDSAYIKTLEGHVAAAESIISLLCVCGYDV